MACYRPGAQPPDPAESVRRVIATVPGYGRAGAATYLTLPEWYIVYSTDEYASFIDSNPPSRFPFFRAAWQYWRYYAKVCRATRDAHPFDPGVHVMLGVIGVSFSVENTVKGAYEGTVGRLTEWMSTRDTEEDGFARRTAREYGAFMHTVPWYEFPFATKLATLWTETRFWGPAMIRKWERKAFTGIALGFTRRGVRFRDIAGNDVIVLTAIAPRSWRGVPTPDAVVLSERMLTDPAATRILVRAPVASLSAVVAGLERGGARIEHLYDY